MTCAVGYYERARNMISNHKNTKKKRVAMEATRNVHTCYDMRTVGFNSAQQILYSCALVFNSAHI